MCAAAVNVTAEFINSMKNSSRCTSVEVHCSAGAWAVPELLLAIDIDHFLTLLNASPHAYGNASLKWSSPFGILLTTPIDMCVEPLNICSSDRYSLVFVLLSLTLVRLRLK